MPSRREFIRTVGNTAILAGFGAFPLNLVPQQGGRKVTILHTNDCHSQIDPWPLDGGPLAGLGGFTQRARCIERIRRMEKHVLLFDAGDIFQGTPHFSAFRGELELKLMSDMKYDAATLGNHDFASGLEGLVRQLHHARFPFVCSNYDFSETVMRNRTVPFRIFQLGDIRIGVFGLGVELDGLVPPKLFGRTRYLDPLNVANEIAGTLHRAKHCHYVICLSHLGHAYADGRVSDVLLARQSRHIDLIIGAHTHTFLKAPVRLENLDGREVWINQVGWAGVKIGRLDVTFDTKLKCTSVSHETVNVTTFAS